ncbi:MAG: phosphatase PAP2 family protein [Eubacterium sp.]|nr:phosphatase PAP2 family protein [Eubacterium sp.]
MDKKLKKQIIFCVSFYFVFFAILMAIGTFCDLEINKAVFDYENSFGVFLGRWGMHPMYILPTIAYSMLIAAYHPIDEAFDIAISVFPFFKYLKNNKITHFICFVLLHALYAFFVYEAFKSSNDFLNNVMSITNGYNLQDLLINGGWSKAPAVIMWTVLRIAFVLIFIIFFAKLDKKYKKALEFMAIAGLAVYYGSDIINVLKAHFHRIRFREMVAYSNGLVNEDGWSSRGGNTLLKEWVKTTDFSAFDRWYRIGNDMGVYSDATSFPSGHTSAAAVSMLLPPLFVKCKALNKYFVPAFFTGFAYTLSVGISRLFRGAHYLTDISSAAIIIFAMILVTVGIMNIFDRISQKHCSSD